MKVDRRLGIINVVIALALIVGGSCVTAKVSPPIDVLALTILVGCIWMSVGLHGVMLGSKASIRAVKGIGLGCLLAVVLIVIGTFVLIKFG